MTVAQNNTAESSSAAFLGSVEGEISFFRSVMRARPIGIHRHFHVLVIQNAILKDTGHLVNISDIWEKLRSYYDLDALDAIDLEADGYETPISNNSTPKSIPSPSVSENLARHPFFRDEFSLPFDEYYEALISQRRMRASVSPPSSPASSVVIDRRTRGARKRGKSKLDMAGLVGGDSDSSALTQESGDEGASGTPRDSVMGTDAGTDYAEDEDMEMREQSQTLSTSPKPARKGPKINKKNATSGKTRTSTITNPRATKKRKR